MTKQYDDELKGAFFPESQSEVIWRGNLTVKGEKKYAVIVQSANRDGKTKHELMISAGLVHLTSEDAKTNVNSPDIGGRVTVGIEQFKFGAWEKTAESGLNFLSCSLLALADEDEAPF